MVMMTAHAFDIEAMANHLRGQEGFRPAAYKCTEGYWTIGIGHRCDANAPTMTREEAEKTLRADIAIAQKEVSKLLKGDHPEGVEFILVSMTFQLGALGLSKFKKMLDHIHNKNYKAASKEMLKSLWAKQTPKRAKLLADAMKEINE